MQLYNVDLNIMVTGPQNKNSQHEKLSHRVMLKANSQHTDLNLV